MSTLDIARVTNAQERRLKELETIETASTLEFYMKGRLTYESGNPMRVTDISGANAETLYLSPLMGGFSELSLPLTDVQNGATTIGSPIVTGLTDTSQLIVGMNMSGVGIPALTTILTVDSTTQVTMTANATALGVVAITFTLPVDENYDITLDANDYYLKFSPAWATDNTRTTALDNADGIYHLNALQTDRYIGTIRTEAAGQGENSELRRFVWNMYNRINLTCRYTNIAADTVIAGTDYLHNVHPHCEFVIGFASWFDTSLSSRLFSSVNALGSLAYINRTNDLVFDVDMPWIKYPYTVSVRFGADDDYHYIIGYQPISFIIQAAAGNTATYEYSTVKVSYRG